MYEDVQYLLSVGTDSGTLPPTPPTPHHQHYICTRESVAATQAHRLAAIQEIVPDMHCCCRTHCVYMYFVLRSKHRSPPKVKGKRGSHSHLATTTKLLFVGVPMYDSTAARVLVDKDHPRRADDRTRHFSVDGTQTTAVLTAPQSFSRAIIDVSKLRPFWVLAVRLLSFPTGHQS